MPADLPATRRTEEDIHRQTQNTLSQTCRNCRSEVPCVGNGTRNWRFEMSTVETAPNLIVKDESAPYSEKTESSGTQTRT